ncbi:MAG: mechanosensitive ion channel family protein [Gemmatimonadota bacterium]
MTPLLDLRGIVESVARFFDVDANLLLRKAVTVALIWLGAWVASRIIKLMARRILASVDDGDDSTMTLREKRGQTIAQLLRSVGRVVILIVALLLTLNAFIEITPLLAGAGILGLAVSFGAQSLVKDIISGFFILLENQFAVGDIIGAGGKSGVVERMTLRVVQLRDLEGILHTIPNGEITVVSNRTRGWSRAVMEIGVAYSTDLDRALAVFRDEASRLMTDEKWKHRLDGAPEVSGIESLGDSSIVIRTLLRTIPASQWDVAREFRRRIKNRLDQEGIEIPFPQRTMHIRVDDERIARTLEGVSAEPEGNPSSRA